MTVLRCTLCGKVFVTEKGQNNRDYKTCPGCRVYSIAMGRKGGNTTKQNHGPEFYKEIGKRGGDKMKRLVNAGREKLGETGDHK